MGVTITADLRRQAQALRTFPSFCPEFGMGFEIDLRLGCDLSRLACALSSSVTALFAAKLARMQIADQLIGWEGSGA